MPRAVALLLLFVAVPAEAAHALTPRGLENLIAFTRLFGVVRYFHASDEAAAADWDALAIQGAAYVESAQDANELASRLHAIFLPIAPSITIAPSDVASPRAIRPAEATAIVSWQHTGLRRGTLPQQQDVYSSDRVRRSLGDDATKPDPLQPLPLDLGGGVSATIPLAVFADGKRTLPRATRERLATVPNEFTGDDRATRIGGIVILWNVYQHFYPYFDVVDVDWRAELSVALTAAATDRDAAAYLVTLKRMVASVDDGHGNVTNATLKRAVLPLLWRNAGEQLIVTRVDPSVGAITVGDEVVAVDGKPAIDFLGAAEALVSAATPQWKRWRAFYESRTGDAGSKAELTIRSVDGTTRIVALTRTLDSTLIDEDRPKKIAEVKRGIWYVDLGRVTDADVKASLYKLASARGIVFDLRGYPRRLDTTLLRHMIGGRTLSARWLVPVLRRPDFAGVVWNATRWTLEPLPPRLPKNLVVLTDGRAISYAEAWLGIIEAYGLAEIVGEPTAGTNGNLNIVMLPGGYRVVFTGMKVLKHDGSRHHGVGIAPTVPVSPTAEGIRAGRDEQLERAIELLERKAAQ